MTETAASSPVFSPFSFLPPELRDQIWRDALPGEFGPALFIYRKGYWRPRHLTESDEGFDPSNDEHNLNFEFRYDLLDDVQFELPLAFVNREARDIALAWAREQGFKARPRKDSQYPLFQRPFDPSRDGLFVPYDKWDEFRCEPDDRLWEPDLYGKLVSIETDPTCIAIPEELFRKEEALISEMLRYFYHIEVLLVVVGEQPAPLPADTTERWEFENVPEGTFLWDSENGWIGIEDDIHLKEKKRNPYKLTDAIMHELDITLPQNDITKFEIRHVVAIRR
ncbi:uncharacterized protein GGS22DRAFT_175631 [Annulohypoxylon maeteangense]|uniref:uncharacterized protein n=1 Tax=Annulohypoxylon maeteangense TaxID=1927788 RepID=UPI002008D6E2|nr:uncharacterized protein GGS22DRAFT_175631 [Annulohypoxylon maeteangense]KAI0880279.1 hypothetical protein GGS22DRAFT_175631 [Annulohypoxylon maeteangense]